MVAKKNKVGKVEMKLEKVPVRTLSLKDRILANLPQEIKSEKNKFKLDDVIAGEVDLETFVAGLTLDELEALSRGDFIMDSPLGAKGNAGVFGGVSESLREKGVQTITTTDGPSGIRLQSRCALLPCGTALASTWNVALLQELTKMQGAELTKRGEESFLWT